MTPVDGLEAYTAAPTTVERPAWIVMEGELWARVDGQCHPVLVDDAASGRLEITTCTDAALACGVVALATDFLIPDHTWCRQEREQITSPLEPTRFVLVTADEGRVTYTQAVQLWVEAVDPWRETQPCSNESLRALRASARDLGTQQPDQNESRTCSGAAGFAVHEMPRPATRETQTLVRISHDRVDCRAQCPPGSLEMEADANAQVKDKWFLAAGAASLVFYRTADTCRAATDTSPSGLPPDVCGTLGAKLR